MSLLEKIKVAGIEYPDHEQIEGDFSMLAFQFIRDRASQLMQYMVGFEIVERNQEGSKVCGVFAYKIGKTVFFIPVFFINGQIKGMVSIFNRDTNMFMQLTDMGIANVLSKHDTEMGQPVERRDMYRESDNIRTNFLQHPLYKAAKEDMTIGEISDMIKLAWVQMTRNVGKLAYDSEASREFYNLAQYVKKAEFEPYDPNTSVLRKLVGWLGPKADQTINTKIASSEELASAVYTLYGTPMAVHIQDGAYEKEAVEFDTQPAVNPNNVGSKIDIEYVTSTKGDARALDLENKAHFQTHGFAVVDERSSYDTSTAVSTATLKRIVNPDHSGVYSVLLKDGKFREMLVMNYLRDPGKMIVMNDMGDNVTVANRDCVFINAADKTTDIKSKTEPINPEKVMYNGDYAFVDKNGDCIFVGTLKEYDKSVDGLTRFIVSEPTYPSVTRGEEEYIPSRMGRSGSISLSNMYPNAIILSDTAKEVSVSGDVIVIPTSDGYSMLSICDAMVREMRDKSDKDGNGGYIDMQGFKTPIGNLADLDVYMEKEGIARLKIEADYPSTSRFNIISNVAKPGTVNYKQASLLLTYGYAIPWSDTREMLKQAAFGEPVDALVIMNKRGQAMLPEQDIYTPYPMFPENMGHDSYTGAAMTQPMGAEYMAETPNYLPPNDPTRYGINEEQFNDAAAPNASNTDDIEDVFELARIAAESGQKSVFDHTGIAGLAKLYDVGGLLDSFIPEMQKSVDRLGRLAFLFYWRNDGFAERFGSNSLPELEDTLLSIYRQFGDMVIKLSEKSIRPDERQTF